MATVFEVFLYCHDRQYAAQAVQAAFTELDRLEQELSRFIENSDIARINHAVPGEWIKTGLDTMHCLQECQQIRLQTRGAFDITVGALVDFWRRGLVRTEPQRKFTPVKQDAAADPLRLDAAANSVRLLKTGIQIDLGGFGKGYALDRMALILKEWGISCALLHSGCSTVLAVTAPQDERGWPLAVRHPASGKVIRYVALADAAISGSGVRKVAHIIDPRSGKPAKARLAAWSMAPTAALADALSTAFMIMTNKQIEKYITDHNNIAACTISSTKSQIRFFGKI